jgi:Pertactin
LIQLKNTTITTSGESGNGIVAETATFGEPPSVRQSTIEADNTTITTSGADAIGAFALFGATINLNGSTVITTGPPVVNTDGATGVYSFLGFTINVTGSTVTTKEASAVQIVDASVMNITDSTLNGGTNGIRIADDDHTLGPDTVTVSGSTITATAAGANEAAIRVDGAEANVTLNSVTDSPGSNNLFLNVISVDKAGKPFNSLVNLTASSSTLTGDILADANSMANVFLEHSSTLNGWVNENNLTGATHLDPNELSPPTVIPPQSVNLGIDSTSTWNMRAGSTLNSLTVNPQAHINFPDPPASFKTLVMNNLVGTGGIFGMHVDLGLIQGDLIEILKTSEGRHLLTFVNRNSGSDLPVRVALLVVTTADGGAKFHRGSRRWNL